MDIVKYVTFDFRIKKRQSAGKFFWAWEGAQYGGLESTLCLLYTNLDNQFKNLPIASAEMLGQAICMVAPR